MLCAINHLADVGFLEPKLEGARKVEKPRYERIGAVHFSRDEAGHFARQDHRHTIMNGATDLVGDSCDDCERLHGEPSEDAEVTPEMIRAGVRVYLLGIDDPAAAVECIFSAMHAAMNRVREGHKKCSEAARPAFRPRPGTHSSGGRSQ